MTPAWNRFASGGEHPAPVFRVAKLILRARSASAIQAVMRRYKDFKGPFSAKGEYEMDLWVVKYASRRSRIGDFSGDSSVRYARMRGVLASGECRAKGAVGSGS
jgi:hypothetical protein